MSDTPTSLRTAREQTIDLLCERYADESLSMGELERRLEKARAATTRDELRRLLEDLEPRAVARSGSDSESRPGRSAPPVPEPAPADATRVEPRPERRGGGLAFAVMGGATRKGRWKPPASMAAVAIMGGVELDFRDANLLDGVTELNCFAFWGGIEIVVPPDLTVESHGFALMGGFDQTEAGPEPREGSDDGPGGPILRINGLALMGAVDIKVAERDRKVPGPVKRGEW